MTPNCDRIKSTRGRVSEDREGRANRERGGGGREDARDENDRVLLGWSSTRSSTGACKQQSRRRQKAGVPDEAVSNEGAANLSPSPA
eukprot:371085-Hanusia_phi.AAC.3